MRELKASADGLAKWHAELGGSLLVEAVTRGALLEELTDLAFEVFGGDEHVVWSSVGPLGADFDEPGDREYASDLMNDGALTQLLSAIRARTPEGPEAIDQLERLFLHPSETIGLAAFELAAERFEAAQATHRIPELAKHALEGHLAAARTKWSGDLLGLRIAMETMVSGSVDIDPPRVSSKLLSAIRKRVTTAHRDFLVSLLTHDAPEVRTAACGWIGQLGSSAWATHVEACLADRDPSVAAAAMGAWQGLSGSLPTDALRRADRSRWSSDHYARVLAVLAYEPRTEAHRAWAKSAFRDPRSVCPADLLSTLLTSAVGQGATRPGPQALSMGVPSLVERILALVLQDGQRDLRESVVAAALSSLDPALASALVRALTASGIETDAVAQICDALVAASSPRLRVVAAEGRMMKNLPTDMTMACAVWHEEFQQDRHGEVPRRFAYAVEGAGVAYAPALCTAMRHVRYDFEEVGYDEGFDDLVAAARRALGRWGTEGQRVVAEQVGREPGRTVQELANLLEADQLDPSVVAQLRAAAPVSELALEGVTAVDAQDPTKNPPLSQRLREQILPERWLVGLESQGQADEGRPGASSGDV